MDLGKNIAKYRKEKNLTQRQLADLLGISFQAVSKWENNHSMPRRISSAPTGCRFGREL